MFNLFSLFVSGRSGRKDWMARMQSSLGEAAMYATSMTRAVGDARHVLGQSTHTLSSDQAARMEAIAFDLEAVLAANVAQQKKIEQIRNALEGLVQ